MHSQVYGLFVTSEKGWGMLMLNLLQLEQPFTVLDPDRSQTLCMSIQVLGMFDHHQIPDFYIITAKSSKISMWQSISKTPIYRRPDGLLRS